MTDGTALYTISNQDLYKLDTDLNTLAIEDQSSENYNTGARGSLLLVNGNAYAAAGSFLYEVDTATMSKTGEVDIGISSFSNRMGYDGTYAYVGDFGTLYQVDISAMSLENTRGFSDYVFDITSNGSDVFVALETPNEVIKIDPADLSTQGSYTGHSDDVLVVTTEVWPPDLYPSFY